MAPRPGNLIAVGVVTAALLYTQYWALYLVAVVGLWLVIAVVRARHHGDPPPWAALGAVVVGGLLFVPWLPTFIYQAKHTGTPWAAPPNFAAVINAITGFTDNQASNLTAGTNQGRLLALVYFALMALALFGVARSKRIIELDLHTQPTSRGPTFIVVGTLFVAVGGGILTGSAFAPRYAAVVFLPLILLVALGTMTLLSNRIRLVVVAIAVVAGLVGSAQNVVTQRTQAPNVANVINAEAEPGDIIAFCPDQLGPSVYRVVVDQSRFDMLTFPRRIGPQRVDWVDYEKTVHAASTASFVQDLINKAGTSHNIWLVWQDGYQTYSTKCGQIASDLATAPNYGAHNWVVDHPAIYYEPMNLTQFHRD
jgi:hypothetical protein